MTNIDVNPGPASSLPANLTIFNGLLHFTASDASGNELWRYNFVNPIRLTDINPAGGSSTPQFLTLFDGALYFSAQDAGNAGTFGRELYRWDGAAATRITDINAGTLSSTPSSLIAFDDALYFAATDQNTVGNELWRYDGAVTPAADINPGLPSSSPRTPIVFDGSLFLRADRPDVGGELWRYVLRDQAGAHTVVLPAGQGAVARDFGNLRVVNAGADRRTAESTPVSLTAALTDPFPASPGGFGFSWQVTADNGQIVPAGTTQDFAFTPTDDGRYTVVVTSTDANDGNRQYRDTVFVFVGNVVPTLDAGADAALNEGQLLTRSLTFTDPGADSWTATIDYGDGSEIVTIPAAELTDRAFDLSHVYTDNGAFTVLVSVTDDDGGTATDTLLVTASNLTPTANGGGDQTVAEGTEVLLNAAVADPGARRHPRLSLERGGEQRAGDSGGGHTDLRVRADRSGHLHGDTYRDRR